MFHFKLRVSKFNNYIPYRRPKYLITLPELRKFKRQD